MKTVSSLHRVANGRVPGSDAEMLAHVLLGAMTEAAMVIARSDNPVKARREATRAIMSLVDSWARPEGVSS